MIRFPSEKIIRRQSTRPALDPLLQFEKHMRQKKIFEKTSSSRINKKTTQLFSSYSPRPNAADKFLENLNSLCESTRRTVFTAKSGVISLKMRVVKPAFKDDNKFETEDNAILSQCKEFINDRRYSLKTQKELVFTKRLQRSVTKKLVGLS